MGIDRTPNLVGGQKAVILLEIKNPINVQDFDAKLRAFLQQFTVNQNNTSVALATRVTTLVTSFVQGPPQ